MQGGGRRRHKKAAPAPRHPPWEFWRHRKPRTTAEHEYMQLLPHVHSVHHARKHLRSTRLPQEMQDALMASVHHGHRHLHAVATHACARASCGTLPRQGRRRKSGKHLRRMGKKRLQGGGEEAAATRTVVGGVAAKTPEGQAQQFLLDKALAVVHNSLDRFSKFLMSLADESLAFSTVTEEERQKESWWGTLKRWGGNALKGVGKVILWLVRKGLDFVGWVMRHPTMATAVLLMVKAALQSLCRSVSISFGKYRLKRDQTLFQKTTGSAASLYGYATYMFPAMAMAWVRSGALTSVLGAVATGVGSAMGMVLAPMSMGASLAIGPLVGVVGGFVTNSMGPAISDGALLYLFQKSMKNAFGLAGEVLGILRNCISEQDVSLSEMAERGDKRAKVLQAFAANEGTSLIGFSKMPSNRNLLPSELAYADAVVAMQDAAHGGDHAAATRMNLGVKKLKTAMIKDLGITTNPSVGEFLTGGPIRGVASLLGW
jgi:hypothetical protein